MRLQSQRKGCADHVPVAHAAMPPRPSVLRRRPKTCKFFCVSLWRQSTESISRSCWHYCGCNKHAQSTDRCLLTQRVPPVSAAAAASAAFRSHGTPASCSGPPLCCAAEASVRTAPSCVLASPLAPPTAAGGAHAADRAALAAQRCLHSPLSIWIADTRGLVQRPWWLCGPQVVRLRAKGEASCARPGLFTQREHNLQQYYMIPVVLPSLVKAWQLSITLPRQPAQSGRCDSDGGAGAAIS